MVKKSDSFETMMVRLEEIVNVMDDKELTLDESMKNYEEGVKLCDKLYKMLNEAEQKIKIITKDNEEINFIKNED